MWEWPDCIQRDMGRSTSIHPVHDVYYCVIRESKGAISRSAIQFVSLDKIATITSERKSSTCVLVIVAFRLLGVDAACGTLRCRAGLLLLRSSRWKEWSGRWVSRLLCRLQHLDDEYDGSGKVRIGG